MTTKTNLIETATRFHSMIHADDVPVIDLMAAGRELMTVMEIVLPHQTRRDFQPDEGIELGRALMHLMGLSFQLGDVEAARRVFDHLARLAPRN